MKSVKTNFITTGLFLLNVLSAQVSIEVAFPNISIDNMVDLQHAPDGSNRIFVVRQEGYIYVFENDPNVSTVKLFLDIHNQVSYGGEMGLLGLAFHPNYSNNGYLYVNYTAPNPLRTVISRFQVNPDNPDDALENTELEILEINQPFSNHNGGQIVFGPDGYLYIGMGDGGSGGDPYGHGQNRATLLGDLLRIDVDNPSQGNQYGIPPDNPFVGNTVGYREEIYAWGLRNPWRFSFDSQTSALWLADVGQYEWEEVDIIVSGGNYGWSIMEGNHCFDPPSGCDQTGLELPIWEYSHNVGHSITGGFVYRGSLVPDIFGKYIFADFEFGTVWALEYDGVNQPIIETLGTLGPYSVTSFGVDENNELYICSFDGKIYKVIQTYEYDEGDLIVLQNIIDINGLSINPLELGEQVWSFGRLARLTYEDAQAPLTFLPYSIGNLDSLQWLRLENNNFVSLPVTMSNLDYLYTLDVRSNHLSDIPTSFGSFANLDSLILTENDLYCSDAYQDTSMIPDFLTDGTIPNVIGLYEQSCPPLAIDGGKIEINSFSLHQNFPNPFNMQTEIRFDLPVETEIRLLIFDLRGEVMRNLVSRRLNAGDHSVPWDGNDEYGRALSSGVYFYQIVAGNFQEVKKMVLMK